MSKIIGWLQTHKLISLLGLVIVYFLIRDNFLGGIISPLSYSTSVGRGGINYGVAAPSVEMMSDTARSSKSSLSPLPISEVAPTDQTNRLVIKDTNLSMVVTDVPGTVAQIETIATTNGGYMVDANVNIPEGAATGYITLRVPEAKRTESLSAIKKLGVKVTSESTSGSDVTDQYVDTDARLATLNATKTKFESILNSAIKVQDILEVQREIINLQSQIDSLKGQQKYLEQSAKLSRISLNLSTDELALPYTPDKGWRPAVIFKEAVRSLVGFLRQAGTTLIWAIVFSPIWLIALVVWYFIRRRNRTKLP